MKPMVNMTLLWDNTVGYAVHCSNKADAELFIQYARELHPEMCTQWSPAKSTTVSMKKKRFTLLTPKSVEFGESRN